MVKNDHYDPVFLDFFKWYFAQSLVFLLLYSVHQNPSFGLSKSTFQHFFRFFTLRGDPYDFGVLKNYPNWKKWLKKNGKGWIKCNQKWLVEVLTSQVELSGTLYCLIVGHIHV